jgi:hypothetical protein
MIAWPALALGYPGEDFMIRIPEPRSVAIPSEPHARSTLPWVAARGEPTGSLFAIPVRFRRKKLSETEPRAGVVAGGGAYEGL